MNLLKEHLIRIHQYLVRPKEGGAIAVEYALSMMIAAFLMLGVFALFKDMSIDIIAKFKQYVVSFPNT
jgi:hypothetical protein